MFTRLVVFVCLSIFVYGADFYVTNQTLRSVEQEYGSYAKNRMIKLINLMNSLQAQSEVKKVIEINKFFNQVYYSSDLKVWGQKDYWASTDEFLGKDRGDCEDYALAKYMTLKQLGVPSNKMFLTYAKSLKYNVAHMVMTYFKQKGQIPYVLGNYIKKILPANERTDLVPVYSFNGDELFLAKQTGLGKRVPSGARKLKKWTKFLTKIQRKQ